MPHQNKKRKHNTHEQTDESVKTQRQTQGRKNREFSQNDRKSPLAKRRDELQPVRASLPIWPHAQEIRSSLRGNKDVLLLVGETGSGKSTQVPQFLLTESWCTGRIAITQPRRVAATSLAKRVAEEMGTPLGSSSPASKVGYSVRFDNSTSPSTQIKFLTEGMLLQEMLNDPWLRQYSAVIVDEVHERSVNVDLLLGFLRNIVIGDKTKRDGMPLKVAVMSATANVETLFEFFDKGFQTVNGYDSVRPNDDIDSQSSWSGFSSDNDNNEPNGVKKSNGVDKSGNGSIEKISSSIDRISRIHVEGRQYPVEIIHSQEPTQDFPEATLKTIFQIHYKEPLPGDILVFLTGQDIVESVESLVNEFALAMGPEVPKVLPLPLFAALPRAAQQAVFQPTPPRTRKVILATNIAETSVTIPGVRYVIDCGLAKVKEFRSQLGLDSLLVKPISQSAAIQRKGRAGREAPGKCYRLYTEQGYVALDQRNVPEILRCDLGLAVLNMKARGVGDVLNFPFLDRPSTESLTRALLQLHRLGALDDDGEITQAGSQMAKMPLSPQLGKVLITAAQDDTDCLLEIIDIISCLTVENIFLNLTTEDKKEEAEEARHELYRREGDHLTLMMTVRAYAAEQSDRKAWAERHFVSHRAMRNVLDVRKQLRSQCVQQKLLPNGDHDDEAQTTITPERSATILKCFMHGFAGNTARLMPDGSYRTMEGNQTVTIHPSSVLFGRKTEAILYNELVYTTKCYARGVSAVQLNWYGETVAH